MLSDSELRDVVFALLYVAGVDRDMADHVNEDLAMALVARAERMEALAIKVAAKPSDRVWFAATMYENVEDQQCTTVGDKQVFVGRKQGKWLYWTDVKEESEVRAKFASDETSAKSAAIAEAGDDEVR